MGKCLRTRKECWHWSDIAGCGLEQCKLLECEEPEEKVVVIRQYIKVSELQAKWKNVVAGRVDTTGECTNCGKQAVWRTRRSPYEICPGCGAVMKGATGSEP